MVLIANCFAIQLSIILDFVDKIIPLETHFVIIYTFYCSLFIGCSDLAHKALIFDSNKYKSSFVILNFQALHLVLFSINITRFRCLKEIKFAFSLVLVIFNINWTKGRKIYISWNGFVGFLNWFPQNGILIIQMKNFKLVYW